MRQEHCASFVIHRGTSDHTDLGLVLTGQPPTKQPPDTTTAARDHVATVVTQGGSRTRLDTIAHRLKLLTRQGLPVKAMPYAGLLQRRGNRLGQRRRQRAFNNHRGITQAGRFLARRQPQAI
ncbi:hypothetical protein D3C86_1594500 [compost metagenome]